jgi:hypothetical protein
VAGDCDARVLPEPFGTLSLARGWDWFTGYLDETAPF